MRSKWSDEEAAGFVARYGVEWGEALALRAYSSRLLGAEPSLVLHGGGNSSVKAWWVNLLNEETPAIFVKASGADMATAEPAGYPGLDLEYLRRLRALEDLSDADMVEELRTHLLRAGSPTPSIEALVHAFLPDTYIDHTHADAVLALTNRDGGEEAVREALGDEVIVMPYVTPGFKLALAASAAREAHPKAWGMVWSHHGIVTWGHSARESYDLMIRLVTRAEEYTARRKARSPRKAVVTSAPPGRPSLSVQSEDRAKSEPRLSQVTVMLRGLLAEETGDCDRPHRRVIVQSLAAPDILAALATPWARETLVTTPLTTDHLIRTKALPLWVDDLEPEDEEATVRGKLEAAVARYCEEYGAYLQRHAALMPAGVQPFDRRPRVVLPRREAACI